MPSSPVEENMQYCYDDLTKNIYKIHETTTRRTKNLIFKLKTHLLYLWWVPAVAVDSLLACSDLSHKYICLFCSEAFTPGDGREILHDHCNPLICQLFWLFKRVESDPVISL